MLNIWYRNSDIKVLNDAPNYFNQTLPKQAQNKTENNW